MIEYPLPPDQEDDCRRRNIDFWNQQLLIIDGSSEQVIKTSRVCSIGRAVAFKPLVPGSSPGRPTTSKFSDF